MKPNLHHLNSVKPFNLDIILEHGILWKKKQFDLIIFPDVVWAEYNTRVAFATTHFITFQILL